MLSLFIGIWNTSRCNYYMNQFTIILQLNLAVAPRDIYLNMIVSIYMYLDLYLQLPLIELLFQADQ